MKEILLIIPVVLYIIVGAISLLMAFKNLFAKRLLPFHEKASGKRWDEIEDPMKFVILSMLRLVGLGFLIMAIILLVFPLLNYFIPNEFYKYFIPGIAFIFCTGLFVINYSIYRKTKADTPWKGSLYAMFIIIVAFVISTFN
jgi:hypothetical protein